MQPIRTDTQQPFTSESHPIHVDFLPKEVVRLPGRIGMTIAPGKCNQGMQVLWQRDLDKDLTRLRHHYHTDLLVSLIEPHELQHLGIPELFTEISAHGMQSYRLPIPDFNTPTSMQDLIDLVSTILAAVEQGKTVVVHCRAGLGRSGLVVAACLVALGDSPDAAFAHVRQARPGSVETVAQEAYVHQFAEEWQGKK